MTCMQCKNFKKCMDEANSLGQMFDPHYDGEHRCAVKRFTPITNGDRIRAMTDKGLAELLENFTCPPFVSCSKGQDCIKCWTEWLRQPAPSSEADEEEYDGE